MKKSVIYSIVYEGTISHIIYYFFWMGSIKKNVSNQCNYYICWVVPNKRHFQTRENTYFYGWCRKDFFCHVSIFLRQCVTNWGFFLTNLQWVFFIFVAEKTDEVQTGFCSTMWTIDCNIIYRPQKENNGASFTQTLLTLWPLQEHQQLEKAIKKAIQWALFVYSFCFLWKDGKSFLFFSN